VNKKQSKPGDQSFELAKLKKENTQLKMELDLLKKATVYFAKQIKFKAPKMIKCVKINPIVFKTG